MRFPVRAEIERKKKKGDKVVLVMSKLINSTRSHTKDIYIYIYTYIHTHKHTHTYTDIGHSVFRGPLTANDMSTMVSESHNSRSFAIFISPSRVCPPVAPSAKLR